MELKRLHYECRRNGEIELLVLVSYISDVFMQVYDRQPPRMAPQARAPNYYPEKKWSREPPTVTKQPMSMVDGDVRDWTSSVTDCTNDINTCKCLRVCSVLIFSMAC